ncbi:MAG: hypothetical protein MZV65_54475 [Chromatiales bacterium]|nr:hypothetical protein [Chromatiales bacterium]
MRRQLAPAPAARSTSAASTTSRPPSRGDLPPFFDGDQTPVDALLAGPQSAAFEDGTRLARRARQPPDSVRRPALPCAAARDSRPAADAVRARQAGGARRPATGDRRFSRNPSPRRLRQRRARSRPI